MKKQDIVNQILDTVVYKNFNINNTATSFAPSNIALVKYWGKSNLELNIPNTDSLSISLGDLGATTTINIINNQQDIVILNNKEVDINSDFYIKINQYLNLFRNYFKNNKKIYDYKFKINSHSNIPIAAGLASSACGFAALILALNKLFSWDLNEKDLSILARLGSGSASRSIWQGFVYWQKGNKLDGMDSFAYLLDNNKQNNILSDLSIGILLLDKNQKPISSRAAMLRTVETSILYQKAWSYQVERDLELIKQAIKINDIDLLGQTAENNALAMHATMLSAKPAICYSTKDTIDAMHKIWDLRNNKNISIYFTQDAGPNLKLIFYKKDLEIIKKYFNDLYIVKLSQ